MSLLPALFSGLTLAAHLSRRRAPHGDTAGMLDLQRLASRCANLANLILQSGDEFSAHSKQLLFEILAITLACRPAKAVGNCIDAGSEAKLGAGAGTGSLPEGQVDEVMSEAELLDLLTSSTVDVQAMSMETVLDRIFSPPEQNLLSKPMEIESPTPSRNSAVEPPTLHRDDDNSWAWLLGNFTPAPDPVDQCPATMANPRPTKRTRPDATQSSPGSAEVSPTSELAPLFQRLATLSLDAMAVEETRTGHIQWSNQAFNELACLVGGGDFARGLHLLKSKLLQAPSYTPSRLHEVIPSVGSGAVEVSSCSVLIPAARDQLYTCLLYTSPSPRDS
eukprot:TRINITY_DN8436_c0_g1_i1.p1 TRINITY_DN8436_c0_g1~~TRINITY_DN8436_c0_g1_i1.p1  ORF type:complete len:334 (+),score=53.58 TRINITY_DN8436_c0_g1_i1:127-1128(+)